MTLAFSTKWPKSMGPEYAGEPNYFPEKIWQSLPDDLIHKNWTNYCDGFQDAGYEFDLDAAAMYPKKHTFRIDSSNRWKVGMKIHPVINNRTKERFQFAPVMEVKSIQNIEIIYDEEICNAHGVEPVIKIDGRAINFHHDDIDEYDKLAVNDGFESVHQFCSWFDKDFTGKIIHWTDLKY